MANGGHFVKFSLSKGCILIWNRKKFNWNWCCTLVVVWPHSINQSSGGISQFVHHAVPLWEQFLARKIAVILTSNRSRFGNNIVSNRSDMKIRTHDTTLFTYWWWCSCWRGGIYKRRRRWLDLASVSGFLTVIILLRSTMPIDYTYSVSQKYCHYTIRFSYSDN